MDFINKNTPSAEEYIDDITYIKEMVHFSGEVWQQYDVLLAARGYGWDMMINWADYVAEADLNNISQVKAGSMGAQQADITESYNKNDCKCYETPELKTEMGILSVAGISQTLKVPMKIVWFNQTRILRFFTLIDDELLIKKYVETVIRRTFGTKDAMKLGKPIPN